MSIQMTTEEARHVIARLSEGRGGYVDQRAQLNLITRQRGNTLAIEFELARLRTPHLVVDVSVPR